MKNYQVSNTEPAKPIQNSWVISIFITYTRDYSTCSILHILQPVQQGLKALAPYSITISKIMAQLKFCMTYSKALLIECSYFSQVH